MTWDKVIERAKKRGSFTDREKDRAGDWNRCAIGEHRGRLKKLKVRFYVTGLQSDQQAPNHDRLDEWGGSFASAVAVNDFTNARKIYSKIKAWVARKEKKK